VPGKDQVRFRLIRADAVPATNPEGDAFVFGLQDAKGQIDPGVRDAIGRLVFDFALQVKPGKDGAPNFLGPYASGPVGDRFVYLSWVSVPRRVYINRLKCRLRDIDWPLIHAAQAADQPIFGDVSGRGPREAMQPVGWRLG
jgi:hypothetical protein